MSLLSDHMQDLEKSSPDSPSLNVIKEVLGLLQNATKLAGKTNQLIMTQRRDAFKKHIPKEMRKICDDPDENAVALYGDNLEERLTKVQAENKLYKALEEKEQKKPSVKSGNSKTHQKARGGSNSNQKDGYNNNKRKETDQQKDRDQKDGKDRGQSSGYNKNRKGGKNKKR